MAFAEVTGTVDYAKRGGKGFTVLERWESQGSEKKRKWHIWFDEPVSLAVGEPVRLRGILSAKIGDPWTDREGQERPGGIELTLNKARFTGGDAPVPSPVDSWANNYDNTDSVPF